MRNYPPLLVAVPAVVFVLKLSADVVFLRCAENPMSNADMVGKTYPEAAEARLLVPKSRKSLSLANDVAHPLERSLPGLLQSFHRRYSDLDILWSTRQCHANTACGDAYLAYICLPVQDVGGTGLRFSCDKLGYLL